jgi:hypothetical protein
MPKPPTTWKAVERFVAKYLGGERTHWALEDARAWTYNIEVKHGKQVPLWLRRAWDQAEKNAGPRTPLLVIHWPRLRREHSLVCMRLDEFRRLLEHGGKKVR